MPGDIRLSQPSADIEQQVLLASQADSKLRLKMSITLRRVPASQIETAKVDSTGLASVWKIQLAPQFLRSRVAHHSQLIECIRHHALDRAGISQGNVERQPR